MGFKIKQRIYWNKQHIINWWSVREAMRHQGEPGPKIINTTGITIKE
jgi:hypothetical protein